MNHYTLDYYINMPFEEYLEIRVATSIKKYKRRANHYHEIYLYTLFATALVGLLMPVLISHEVGNWLILVICFMLMVSIAIINAYYLLGKCKGCRTAEALISAEQYNLQSKSKDYTFLGSQCACKLFITRVESIIQGSDVK